MHNHFLLDHGTFPQGGMGDRSVEVEDSSEEVEENVVLPDVQERREELGEPIRRTQCFGCRFVGEDRMPSICNEKLMRLMRVIAKGIGKTDPVALALEAAALYDEIRRDTIDNPDIREPLPEWTPASIIEHFYYHSTDPELNQWLHLDRLTKLMRFIEEESLIVYNKKKRKRFVDKDQFNIWNQAMKTWYLIAAKDPSKLAFYNEGSHIDVKSTAKSGIIEYEDKRMYNFFKNKCRRL